MQKGGEDVMAVVVQDEVIIEVPGAYRRMLVGHPGVASFGVVQFLLSLFQHGLVVTPSCSEFVPAAVDISCLLILTIDGVGVGGDDRNLVPLC